MSSAIKGALLMAAEKDREKDLERKVRQRTLELSTANQRLLEEIARRKDLEKEVLTISNLIMDDIGRDIHDNLCQDIAVLGIMGAVLEGKLSRSGMKAESEEAAAIARNAGLTAAKAKDMARGLYPVDLEAKGIVNAIEAMVNAARKSGSASLKLEVSKDFIVKDSQKAFHLFRMVQEALSNALKHSHAKEIRVGLYIDRENITTEVSDDGQGFSQRAQTEGGMGLQILKYRAGVIGAELRVRSGSAGTTITCRVAR